MSINFALIGAGRIARVHSDAIAANGANIVACFDPSEGAAQSICKQWSAYVAASPDEAMSRDDVDAVIVASPSDAHVAMIRSAIDYGKRVFCEKPLASSLLAAKTLVSELGDAESRRVQIGFNRRFDPSHSALRAACSNGEIGNLEQLVITSRDPEPPPHDYVARSGGIYRDMTIHDIDLARWILDEEVEAVSASGSRLVDPGLSAFGDFDTAMTILRSTSGRQCIIINSRRAIFGYDQRIEAFGERGMISSENHSPVRVERSSETSYRSSPRLMNFFIDRYKESFRAEIASFIDTVVNDAEAKVTALDGIRAMEIAEAATVAAKTSSWITLKGN